MTRTLMRQASTPALVSLLLPSMREVHEKIVAQGNQVGGGTPEEFGALIRAETAKWGKVVREAGVRAD